MTPLLELLPAFPPSCSPVTNKGADAIKDNASAQHRLLRHLIAIVNAAMEEPKVCYVFACDSCLYVTTTERYLWKHRKIHEEQKQYQCAICPYGAIEKQCLANHIKSVHEKAFDQQCEICSYKTVRKNDLKMHIKRVHKKIRDFKCNLCNYESSERFQLQNHKNSVHLNVFPHQCTQCDFKSVRRAGLEKHVIRSHHGGGSSSTNRACQIPCIEEALRKFQCPKCSYSTNEKACLVLHAKRAHDNSLDLTCPKCNYATVRKADLRRHIQVVHDGIKRFKCDKCEYSGSERTQLQRHVNSAHDKVYPFACEICTFATVKKASLVYHINTAHSVNWEESLGDFEYFCRICETHWASSKAGIRKHMKETHGGSSINQKNMMILFKPRETILVKLENEERITEQLEEV